MPKTTCTGIGASAGARIRRPAGTDLQKSVASAELIAEMYRKSRPNPS